MKKIFIFWLFFLVYNNTNAQDFIKHDTINIYSKTYNITHVSFGNTSFIKYYKVFTCDTKQKEEFIKTIVNCKQKHKLEYSEYYIIFIPDLNSLNSFSEKKIATLYVDKIDSERMKLNLKTSRIKFIYDYKNDKFKYLINEQKRELKSLENVFLKTSLDKICIHMKI